MSTAPPTFQGNERVLCYHGPLMYEAKVLKVAHFDEATTTTGVVGPHYFVHYKGWKQTWDEWVPYTRLLKYDDVNLATSKQLLQQAQAAAATASTSAPSKSKSHAAGASTSASAGGGGGGGRGDTRSGRKDRGTKRGREEDEPVAKKPEMKLDVPEGLKMILVDDWEAITKNNQVVKLPRTPSVAEILAEFQNYILEQPKTPNLRDPPTLVPTIIQGLQLYFDRSLGSNLLYRFERGQYGEMRKQYVTGHHVKTGEDDKEMSAVYGAEHLLRMLVSLPQMVTSSTMDPESVGMVKDYVNALLQFLLKERARFFLEYEHAGLGYQNVVRS